MVLIRIDAEQVSSFVNNFEAERERGRRFTAQELLDLLCRWGQEVEEPKSEELICQQEDGEYREEVERIVDGVCAAITEGEFCCIEEVEERLTEGVYDSTYVNDYWLAVLTLIQSKHPTARLFESSRIRDDVAKHERLHGKNALPWDGGKKAFPFTMFSYYALDADCREELTKREEYVLMTREVRRGEEEARKEEGHTEESQ